MKLAIESEIVMAQLDDEMSILNVITGKYYFLKGSGVRMWELLQKHSESDTVFDIMKEEYDVEPVILKRDLNKLIGSLISAKLVKPL